MMDDVTVNSEDDGEGGHHDQLPSVEEARMMDSSSRSHNSFNKRRLWFALAALLIVLAVIIGLAVGIYKSKNAGNDDRLEEVTDYLSSYSDPVALRTPGTPQYRAAEWIANKDPFKYEINDTPHFLQRYALVVFYYATGGDDWRFDWNFLTDVDECYWNVFGTSADQWIPFGVACSGDGNIVTVIIADNNLVGHLPPEMGLLTKLNFLWIPDNLVGGTLTEELHKLTDIDVINVDRNLLWGPMPSWLGELRNISYISLQQNTFTGQIPSEVGLLTYLERLELEVNELSGTVPTEIQKLKFLEMLTLGRNAFTGELKPWLPPDMEELTGLGLNNNRFSGPLPDALGNLTSLTRLFLDDNLFTGKASTVLNSLTNLDALFLEDNLFEQNLDDGDFLTTLTNLTIFDASDNRFFGSLPLDLLTREKLKILDLHGNSLSGIPNDIPANAVLEFLALHENPFNQSIPATISNLFSLRHLDLSSSDLNGDMPDTLGNSSSLTYLFLANNSFIPGTIPEFVRQLTNLRELSLKLTNREGTIPSWFNELNRLILLDLDNNRLTGTVPVELGDVTSLQYLLLNRNQLNGTLPSFFQMLPSLRRLQIEENDIRGDAGPLCNGEVLVGDLSDFAADCDGTSPEVTCPCCTLCCQDGTLCNEEDLLANSDPNWESRYSRVVYDFTNELEDIF